MSAVNFTPWPAYGGKESYRSAAAMSTCALCVTALLQGCSSAYALSNTPFALINPCCQAVDGFLAE